MTFYNSEMVTILFDSWDVKNTAGYVASLFAVAAMTFVFEWGKTLRVQFTQYAAKQCRPKRSTCEHTQLLPASKTPVK